MLNQLLYAQRRQVRSDALFTGRKTLRLNREVIGTDVGEFEEALERGALEEGVALYGGPFLDGFFLKDAPEFEEWVAGHRERLARRCLDALQSLGESAVTAGKGQDAVRWWRRAAELDPFDSAVAIALVGALEGAGDRPGTLRHARQHADSLRSQLGVSPDPAFSRVLSRLEGAV